MTDTEALQALLALCSAIVAVGVAVAILVPSEPVAPGQFGDHHAAVALTRTPAPATPQVLPPSPPPDVPPLALSDVDIDRLWAAIASLDQSRPDPDPKGLTKP